MEFQKYQHIERYGTDGVEDINIGTCYVFPKIDGTNASVWLNDLALQMGSRNRHLTADKDNANFFAEMSQNVDMHRYLTCNPTHRLFGEWLVPHTLKTYRADAWKKFYVFDVCETDENGELVYLPYEQYKEQLDRFGIDYISPIAMIKNGTEDAFVKLLDKNTYLVKDGEGFGEGIVIKNYEYKNKYGKTVWAKIVRNEFKEKHGRMMGAAKISPVETIEVKIIDEFVTKVFIEKEQAKLIVEQGFWGSKMIPMFLGKAWHVFITEEIFNILKKYKNPKIDFKLLNKHFISKIKQECPEIF